MTAELRTVGEGALMLYLGNKASPATSALVQAATASIEQYLGNELLDLVPAYASVLVLYDPLRSDHISVMRRVRAAVATLDATPATAGVEVVLPVYYAAEAGADLEALAQGAGLTIDEVVAAHTGLQYRVYAIGFAPGFAYLGEVDQRIAAPRHATPRLRVPRGAVAISERQTAVYPAASPGGWNLIGRCPLRMFDPTAQPCMPVAVGDSVRFESITRERYFALGGELE